jgi:hypothetical protein
MAKKKIDKKSLDAEITNALLDDFDKFENFAITHWKKIIAVACIIVIGVAVYSTVVTMQRKADDKMVTTLVNAKKIDELKVALEKYPASAASIGARLRLAVLYREAKQYTEAADELVKVAATADIPVNQKYRAKLDIAYLDELAGELENATGKFSAVASDAFAPQAMKCEGAYSAGRIYLELKNNTKATQYLQEAVSAGALDKSGLDLATDLWQRQAKALLMIVPATSIAKK